MLRLARMELSSVAVAQHDNDRAVECLQQVRDEFPDDAGGSTTWATCGPTRASTWTWPTA